MKNIVKFYLSFIENHLFKTYYEYVFVGVISLILFLDILFIFIKWNKISFSKTTGVLTYLLLLLVFGEWYFHKKTFSSLETAIVISVSLLTAQTLISTLLKAVKINKKPKVFKVDKDCNSEVKIDSLNYGLSIKNAVEKLKLTEEEPMVFSGFIDLSYVKSLIESLNKKDLEEKDRLEVEELEVYLLNFVNRQPSELEREVLSKHLGGLIKKLAKYQAV